MDHALHQLKFFFGEFPVGTKDLVLVLGGFFLFVESAHLGLILGFFPPDLSLLLSLLLFFPFPHDLLHILTILIILSR